MIRARCPNCQKNLVVKPELAGRLAICPGCQNKLRIPELPKPKEKEPIVDSDQVDSEEQEQEAPRLTKRTYVDESLVEDEVRPKRRKRKRRQSESSSSFFSEMDTFTIAVIAVGALSALAVVVSFVF